MTQTQYDTASRAYRTIDNLGRITETQVDALGRTVRTIQNYIDGVVEETDTTCDLTTEYQFDSAGRMVTLVAVNAKGLGNGVERQETKYLYTSAVNPSWQTIAVYPESADVLTLNTTTGDWTITTDLGDHVSTEHDLLGRVTETTDQRGVVHSYSFDTAGRLSADVVTNTVEELESIAVDSDVLSIGRTYDDLGRLAKLTSYHDIAGTSVANEVAYRFDGWGNLVQEWQAHEGAVDNDGDSDDTPSIQYVYSDGLSEHTTSEAASYVRLEDVVYPNGRTLIYGYGQSSQTDSILSRVKTIATEGESTAHAEFTYLGAGMIASETFNEPQVRLDYGDTLAGLDRFGRVADQVWEQFGQSNETLDEYLYGYDRASNRTSRTNALHAALSETYNYDDLDRLLDSIRGGEADQAWNMDGLGNFNSVTDGSTTQDRTHNAANELTAAEGMVSPEFDAAGNTVTAPKPGSPTTGLTLKYDAWNRTSQVSQGDIVLGRYEYDGQGRRILKFTPANGTADAKYEHFYLNGQQVAETREVNANVEPGTSAVKYQFINSPRYIDAVILRDQYSAGTIQTASRLFYTSDANFNVTGLVGQVLNSQTGLPEWKIVERYAFDPYGKTLYLDAGWAALANQISAFNNTNLYTGRTLDLETGYFYYRARLYDTNLMRFLGRDPIGYRGGLSLYEYAGGGPIARTDPSGLEFCAWVTRSNAFEIPFGAHLGLGHLALELDKDGRKTLIELQSYNDSRHRAAYRVTSGPLGPASYLNIALGLSQWGLTDRSDLAMANMLSLLFFGMPATRFMQYMDLQGRQTLGGGPLHWYGIYVSPGMKGRGERFPIQLGPNPEAQFKNIKVAVMKIAMVSETAAMTIPVAFNIRRPSWAASGAGEITTKVGLGYDPVRRNSNSFIGSVLRATGLKAPPAVTQMIGFNNEFTAWTPWDLAFQAAFREAFRAATSNL